MGKIMNKFNKPYYINIYFDSGIYSQYQESYEDALEAVSGDVNNATAGSIEDYYRATLYVKDHKIQKKFVFNEDDIVDDGYNYNDDHRLGSFELCGVR